MLYQGLTECQVEQHIDKDNLTMHLHHGRRKNRSLHPGLFSDITPNSIICMIFIVTTTRPINSITGPYVQHRMQHPPYHSRITISIVDSYHVYLGVALHGIAFSRYRNYQGGIV